MNSQVCSQCGAARSPDELACRFCHHSFDDRPSLALRISGAVLSLLIMGILVSASMTVVFGVFGLVLWLASGEIGVLWLCLGFGAFFGFLFGIGSGITTFLEDKLRSAEDSDPASDPPARPVLGGAPRAMLSLAGALSGIFQTVFFIASLVLWFFGSHKQRKAPGRGQRIVFATLLMTVLGTLFTVVSHWMIAPRPPQGLQLWQAAAIFIPIFMIIGFLLGMASRDW